LNGVNLLGVDSATTPMPLRKSLWQLLQKEWRPDALHQISETVNLHNLPGKIELILQGKIRGRIVVKH
jgi:acrylyl-CoA reductase (NADPH)